MTNETWKKRTTDSVELYRQAKYRQAETGFSEAVRLARDAQATGAELGEALNNLSIAYYALSRLADCQNVLNEALSLSCATTNEQALLRICSLNNRAKLLEELEQYAEAEADLLEAIELAKPLHPSYAAEIACNLARMYALIPRWRDRAKEMSKEFERLHQINEPLEIYYDDIAGWRRPGKSWDRAGCTSRESIEARIIGNRASCLYDSKKDAVGEFKAILDLDQQTKAVAPHLVVYAQLSLAEASFQAEDYQAAAKYCEEAVRTADSSYLKMHPANYVTILQSARYSFLTNSADKSSSLFNRAEELVRGELGERNQHFAHIMAVKALMLGLISPGGTDATRDKENAFRKSLALTQDFYPDNHSRVIVLNSFLADICIRTNRLEEAEQILTQTIQNAQNSFQANEMECRCLLAFADLRLRQGRTAEAKDYINRHEALLEQQELRTYESKLQSWMIIGKQYVDGGLFDEAERLYKTALERIPPERTTLVHKATVMLASCLMQGGKAEEASVLLGKGNEKSKEGSQPLSKSNELSELSRLAWAMQNSKRFDEAKEIAANVVNEAELLMPECEESLVIAVSVLVEQAKRENKADEILRLTGILAKCQQSIRLRCTMPTFYLEAAKAFAQQRSIKAESLFEQAIQAAEQIQAIQPKALDLCCCAYMNHCKNTRKQEKALQICERVLKLRAAADGTKSQDYANALTLKAQLLIESDPNGADASSELALKILDDLPSCSENQLLITLAIRAQALKKLLRFDKSAELDPRLHELKDKLKKKLAEAKE